MTAEHSFITRLRRHRQRARVTLEEIAAATRIKVDMLEAFEAGDLSRWPRGLYARSWVRSYAHVIGLDPEDVVDEFCRVFPIADRRGQATVEEIAALVSARSEFDDTFEPARERRGARKIANGAPGDAPVAAPVALTTAKRFGVRLAASLKHLSSSKSPRHANLPKRG